MSIYNVYLYILCLCNIYYVGAYIIYIVCVNMYNIHMYICVHTYVYITYIHTHIVFTKYCGKPLTSKLFTFLFF